MYDGLSSIAPPVWFSGAPHRIAINYRTHGYRIQQDVHPFKFKFKRLYGFAGLTSTCKLNSPKEIKCPNHSITATAERSGKAMGRIQAFYAAPWHLDASLHTVFRLSVRPSVLPGFYCVMRWSQLDSTSDRLLIKGHYHQWRKPAAADQLAEIILTYLYTPHIIIYNAWVSYNAPLCFFNNSVKNQTIFTARCCA